MTQQKSNKAALYILMFNMFIVMGSIGIIIPVMPEYLRIFGAAGQVLGMLIATFAFAQFVFLQLLGIFRISMVEKILLFSDLY